MEPAECDNAESSDRTVPSFPNPPLPCPAQDLSILSAQFETVFCDCHPQHPNCDRAIEYSIFPAYLAITFFFKEYLLGLMLHRKHSGGHWVGDLFRR